MAIINWRDSFSSRELSAIDHALMYADRFSSTGSPGHTQYLLIAKLVKLIDQLQDRINAGGKEIVIKKVTFDHSDNCWRDIETGIRTEV